MNAFDGIPFTGPEQRRFVLRLLIPSDGRQPKAFHTSLGPQADLQSVEGIEALCKSLNDCFDSIEIDGCQPHVVGDSRRPANLAEEVSGGPVPLAGQVDLVSSQAAAAAAHAEVFREQHEHASRLQCLNLAANLCAGKSDTDVLRKAQQFWNFVKTGETNSASIQQIKETA